jgi:Tfp pilus assembly protein PilO
MAGFRDLPMIVNVLLALLLAVLIIVLGLYVPGSPLQAQTVKLADVRSQITLLDKEVAALKDYERRHADLKQKLESQQRELDNLRTIVPEEKEVDEFIRMVHGAAVASGVEIRRITAKPPVARDYHNELPFELGSLSRIINVSDLDFLGPERASSTITKYSIRPSSTVVAVSTVTTFFTKEIEPPPAKGGKAPGKAGAKTPAKQPAKK